MMIRWLLALLVPLTYGQQVPRPEYPQPQFEREHWMTLNGSWDFEFDDQNRGLEEGWAGGQHKFSRSIQVPFCFESQKSGIGDISFHPQVWYRKTFTLPSGWQGKRVLLHFGAVDYRAQVWINGQMTGQHEGGHTPFWFDITPLLRSGANTLVVRAEDPPTDRYLPRGKQYWEPKSRGIFYTRTTGIWQPVWLEATGDSYLQRIRITADNDGRVAFEGWIARPRKDLELRATISFQGQTVARTAALAQDVRVSALAYLSDPRLWSPGSPNLYDVVFELHSDGQMLDRVKSYFGIRRVTVENGKVLLNGRPIYLKMVLDQGYWPESTITPPSDEAVQYDIKMTLAMGFNGARKHQKLEDPRYLYWADRLGLLVSSEMANAYLFDEQYAIRFTREWMEALQRDMNHPSIILWVPINESWGVPDLRGDKRQQAHLRSLYLLTKALDPSRLVIDNDGWEHTDLTDLFALHDYAPNGEALLRRYQDLGKPGARIPDNARAALVPGFSYNGAPFVLSEFGGVSYIMPGQQAPESAWGYAGLEPNQESAFRRISSLYEAIRRIPAFVGICYTQLTDVEQEINGLLTYDRKPKFDLEKIKALNASLTF